MKLYTFPASPGCRPIAMFIADHKMEVEQQVVDLMSGDRTLLRRRIVCKVFAIDP